MNKDNLTKEQQAQNKSTSKKWLVVGWTIVKLTIRVANIVCTVINYFEGGDE
ncbi:hypothetical protein ACS25C_16975 [Dickeya undicola]|uniref:hypothetical protein n=1 Tax=Dickeya TaxID=204037 RepID=UPI000363D3B5|nr:hypothetical protein [Dickeya zeae]AJC66964.1 hypothetical protein W909_13130 [Dickeya zeae EC1]